MLKPICLTMALLVVSLMEVYAHSPMTMQEQFITKYSPIAVLEMHRSGIPASITLAQAILESQWGRSDLARNSNNYFGIKCKNEWIGGKYFHEDDDYDANGKLTKSCFRVYSNIEASFKDHTNFLLNRHYYRDCFKHQSNEYFEWSVALQQAGYATADDYAVRLIDLIEKYNLHTYDTVGITQAENPVVTFQPVSSKTYHVPQMPTEMQKRQDRLETTPIITQPKIEEGIVQAIQEELVPPPAEQLPLDYRPNWMEGEELTARAGIEGQTIQPAKGTTYYQVPRKKEDSPIAKEYPYRRDNSTYKKHIRPIKYYPRASNATRR